jgi:hypothetical protein
VQAYVALRQILGHVRIIGSTVALGSSIVSGAWYIVYQPYQEMRAGSGWAGVARGVLLGTSRFVGEVGSGFFYIIGQFAEGVGMGVRYVTFVDMPLARSLLRKPPSLTHGVVLGTMVLTADAKAAATSLVKLPHQGWQEHGALGALQGAARGLSGLLLPLAGVLDLTAYTVFGVASEIASLGAQGRRRGATHGPRRNHVQVRLLMHAVQRDVVPPESACLCRLMNLRSARTIARTHGHRHVSTHADNGARRAEPRRHRDPRPRGVGGCRQPPVPRRRY